jgi:membrane protease YdiL (CAAX protease family)
MSSNSPDPVTSPGFIARITAWITTPAASPASPWTPLQAFAVALIVSLVLDSTRFVRFMAWLLPFKPVMPITSVLVDWMGVDGVPEFLEATGDVLTICVMVALVSWRGPSVREVLRLGLPSSRLALVVVPLIAFAAYVLFQIILIIAMDFISTGDQVPAKKAAALASAAQNAAWISAAMINLLKPLGEEIVYRAFLFPALAQRWLGFWGAALISSVLFAAEHVQYTMAGKFEMVVFGVTLCWAMWKTSSLWPGLIAHVMWNLCVSLNPMTP